MLMLSTLKIKILLPQNDEKSMSAPFDGVSKKGCWVTGRGHVPVHVGLIVSQGCSWVPAEPGRSFSFSFFAGVSSPSSEAPETDKTWKGEAKKEVWTVPPGGIKHSQGNDHLRSHTWGLHLAPNLGPGMSLHWPRLARAVGLSPFICSKACNPFHRVEGEFYLIISPLLHG